LYYEYVGDPRGAVRQAAELYFGPKGRGPVKPDRDAGAAALKSKEKQKGLPAAHKPTGGSPAAAGAPTGENKGPKNLKEAFKNINAKLKAKGLA